MTDNEIVKALERCGYHNECCYCNSVEECGSKRALVVNALDLINRQKAELERKDIEIDNLIKKKDAAYDEVAELRAEVEMWQEKRNKTMDNLKAVLDERADHTEVIKEFAEKLKEKIYSQVIRKKIDYTVEEMVGD